MLLAYYPPIDSHALHVYESALATMPECALFATVNTEIAADVRLISARQGSWTATLRVIEIDRCYGTSISFSPDGTQLASNSKPYRSEIKIWSVKTGAQLAVLEMAERHGRSSDQAETYSRIHELFVPSVAYSPDGTRIASSFCSGSIVWLALWDTKTYQQLAVLGDPRDSTGQPVTDCLPVSFLPGSSLVVFGCDDGTICVWDPSANTGTLSFEGSTTSKVWAVACSPDGSNIVSGLANGSLRVWHSRTGDGLATLEGHSDRVNSIAFSTDGAQLVSGSNDWSIRIWDIRMNEAIFVLQSQSYVSSVAFSPDGRQVVSGSGDETICIWDVQSTKQITLLQGHHAPVSWVSFSPDGALLASGSWDGTIRVWDMQTLPRAVDHPDAPNSILTDELSISLDGARLVSTAGAVVRVWDMQTGQEIAVLDRHAGNVWFAAFSPDSNSVRVVTGSMDKTVRVWHTQTGQELARFSVNASLSAVAISADGIRVVACLRDATMPVWDVSSGVQLVLFEAHQDQVLAVALSPDGSRVVCSGIGTAQLWDVGSGEQVALIECPEIEIVAFSPDGLWIFSSSHRGPIQAWDMITGAHIGLLEELNYSMTVVAYSFRGVQRPSVLGRPSGGRELRITFDCGDMMIHQDTSSTVLFPYAYGTHSTASRIGESDLHTMRDLARSAITWDETTGWLFCNSVTNDRLPLFWLPVERRGPAMICGRMVAVGGTGGKVTMLDFTKTIERLHIQGLVHSP
jgi:WD40 repeat protein